MELLDAVIDRCADILERCGAEIDQVSHDIFEPEQDRHGHAKLYAQILNSHPHVLDGAGNSVLVEQPAKAAELLSAFVRTVE